MKTLDFIQDNFYINDDIEKLKDVLSAVRLTRLISLLIAIKMDISQQDWFYSILQKSDLFDVIVKSGVTDEKEARALIDFNGLPTIDSVELAVSTIFGAGSYIEVINSNNSTTGKGIIRVFIAGDGSFIREDIGVIADDSGEIATFTGIAGEVWQAQTGAGGNLQGKYNLMQNFTPTGIKIEFLPAPTKSKQKVNTMFAKSKQFKAIASKTKPKKRRKNGKINS